MCAACGFFCRFLRLCWGSGSAAGSARDSNALPHVGEAFAAPRQRGARSSEATKRQGSVDHFPAFLFFIHTGSIQDSFSYEKVANTINIVLRVFGSVLLQS